MDKVGASIINEEFGWFRHNRLLSGRSTLSESTLENEASSVTAVTRGKRFLKTRCRLVRVSVLARPGKYRRRPRPSQSLRLRVSPALDLLADLFSPVEIPG
jgi:hypothetical protein